MNTTRDTPRDRRIERTRLKQQYRSIHRGADLEWRNGTLVFSRDGKPVPDCPKVPKPPLSERGRGGGSHDRYSGWKY